MALPNKVHGSLTGGSHQVAIDRTKDIRKYLDQAISSLETVKQDDLSPLIRGGHLLAADDLLDTIIRFAQCAKDEMREAHCRS